MCSPVPAVNLHDTVRSVPPRDVAAEAIPPSGAHAGAPLRKAAALGDVVQWYKTMTTNAYIRGVREHGWKRFDGRLWQRNYYEHVVRNDDELARAREYIQQNPLRWHLDRENPARNRP